MRFLVSVIGFDVGGANTKAAFISATGEKIEAVRIASRYLPIWRDREKLVSVLLALREELRVSETLDYVSLTMTAELADVFQTKKEGVDYVVSCVSQVFSDVRILVLDVNGGLRSVEIVKSEPLVVAAANWVATGWLVAQLFEDCVVVDVGSTSTSIIPILQGRVSALGNTDLEKLIVGELVYTGSLRTNVAAIVNSIPIRESVATVSSELFAQSGDVHLVLGNITPAEFTAETADGRGKSREEAMARLARVVCADLKMLTEEEVIGMAKYIYAKQIDQVVDGLNQVYSRIKSAVNQEIPVVVTGMGKDFIGKKAAQRCRIKKIIDLEKFIGSSAAIASPAFAVALMAVSKLEGRIPRWMQ